MTTHTKAMGATFLLVTGFLGIVFLGINYPDQTRFAGACGLFALIAGVAIFGIYRIFYNTFDPNYEPPRHY